MKMFCCILFVISILLILLIILVSCKSQINNFSNTCVTIKRGDGFGAQFLSKISAYAYSVKHNINYYNTLIEKIEHNVDPKEMEDFTGFSILSSGNNDNCLTRQDFHPEIFKSGDINDYFTDNVLHKIRNAYRHNKNGKPSFLNNNNFNISIHYRVVNKHDNRGSANNISEFQDIINELQNKYNNTLFHIFSQNTKPNLKANNILFHIDTSLKETFEGMTEADCLVVGRSALSYSAALLNPNQNHIYMFTYWIPPLKKWNEIGDRKSVPKLLEKFSNENKVISFCLYGNNPIYTIGMEENIKLTKQFYPDWTVWIYVDNNISKKFVDIYNSYNNIVIKLENNVNTIHRFLPLFEDNIDIVIFRDADSRILDREVIAVNEWIKSGKQIHIMRDDYNHNNWPINAGMWGARTKYMKKFKDIFIKHLNSSKKKIDDQRLLKTIYKEIDNNDIFVHDDLKLNPKENPKSYGTVRDKNNYIGKANELQN